MDSALFATGGVCKRIRVYDFRQVLGGGATPVAELDARSKVSCLSYSRADKARVACSDYAGRVSVFDTATQQCVLQYEEVRPRAAPQCCAAG